MSQESHSSGAAEEPLARDRLESWKEIATYLKRGVTTVQRWEKQEGLPVHRHQHDKLGTVYALKSEIDVWFSGRRQRLEQQEEESVETKSIPSARIWVAAASLLILVAVAGTAYFVWESHRTAGPGGEGKIMLAVLPVANLSGDPGQDPLADGMTEEMIGQLGMIHPQRLRVIARTSAMRFKGKTEDVQQIGRELGVDYLVEGSLRREANKVRVHVQLIRASDRTSLWAGTYDRDFQGVLALETEIAQQIAHSLMIELIPSSSPGAARTSTRGPGAYEAFLKASYLFNKGTPDALKESVGYFEDAIRADPGFTLAYAGLADSYNLLGSYLVLPAKEAFPEAEKAANKALELDGNSAEAHNALALARFYYDWNWADAENHFKRAIALNPGYSRAHHWYAWYLSLMGRHAAALEEVRTAQELDPLSPQLNTDIGWFYYRARRYDEAVAQFKRTLQLEPDFIQGHVSLARAYLQKGMYSEARMEMREALSRSGAGPQDIAALTHSDPVAGIHNFRRLTLERLKKDKTQSPAFAYAYAEVYVLLGENDHALMWLDRAYAEHYYRLVFLKVEPTFDPLRSEPRFQQLLRRVGLPQ